MADLPAGTVTFLCTDLEGSTRLLQAHPAAMRAALARPAARLEALVTAHGGVVVRPRSEGDSRSAVFARAPAAVAAGAAIQPGVPAAPWPAAAAPRVRLAVHTGEAALRAGDCRGSAVHRAARRRAAGEHVDQPAGFPCPHPVRRRQPGAIGRVRRDRLWPLAGPRAAPPPSRRQPAPRGIPTVRDRPGV